MPGKEPIAEGLSIGGNLSTFSLLLGTRYMPALKDKVIFLEYDKEEGFALPAIQRFLWQLRQAAPFSAIAGLVFGVLEQCVQEEEKAWRSLESILLEVSEGYDFPVYFNAHFGHVYPITAIPNSRKVRLKNEKIFFLNEGAAVRM